MATWKSYYRRPGVSLSIVLGLAWVAGCHKPAPPQGPTAEFIEPDDVDPLWQASQSVLRKHDFQIDRQDLAAGVIETLPTTSQHYFEFWRQDVADPYSFGQATMHTMQRKATVRFVKAPNSQWNIELQVDVYRLSTPEHQVTSASSALLAFSGGLPTTTGQVGVNASKQREWVPQGRDGELESRLLSQIFKAAGRTPVAVRDGAYAEPVTPETTATPTTTEPLTTPRSPQPTPQPQAQPVDPVVNDGQLTPL